MVVALGDSITDGIGSTPNMDLRYPSYLSKLWPELNAMIRDAIEADVPLLAGIEARAAARFAEVGLPSAASLPLLDTAVVLVAAREKRLLVAVDDADVAVGFALMEACSDGDAHLLELDVEPAHGGRGIGRALISASVDWAFARGLRRLTLTTFRDIPFNAPLYARVGFENPRSGGIRTRPVRTDGSSSPPQGESAITSAIDAAASSSSPPSRRAPSAPATSRPASAQNQKLSLPRAPRPSSARWIALRVRRPPT